MLSVKNVILVAVVGVVFIGCGSRKELPLGDVVNNSYQITKEMNQSTVSSLMPMKPTSVQRINDEEIWKYEGNVCDTKTEDRTYHNLIIKFVDGKVKHIGTFSCKLPVVAEK